MYAISLIIMLYIYIIIIIIIIQEGAHCPEPSTQP